MTSPRSSRRCRMSTVRARGTLLRRYWLPLAATTLAVWAAIWLLLSRLG